MKKSRIIVIATLLIFVILGVLVFKNKSQTRNMKYTDPIQRGTILESVYGIGTVTARKSYQLKSGVTNIIEKIYVREGDQVKKNGKLLDLESATFLAPFAGTVTWVPVKEGELAFAQAVLLTLTDLTDRYLIVSLDQRGALRVKNGQKAKISFDSFRDEAYEGFVESVYANDNNFLIRIDASKLPSQILPGMTADVAIGIVKHDNVLLIPTSAISEGRVLVQQNSGQAKSRVIQIGIVDGTMAEVLSGDLKEGDRLAIQKQSNP